MSVAPRSEIFSINNLINYQTGAIISYQIMKAEGGNVTLFAFDEGQELSAHTAPYDALVHVLDGEVDIMISGKNHHLKAGEGIIMPANESHAVQAVAKFKMLLTMIRA